MLDVRDGEVGKQDFAVIGADENGSKRPLAL